MEPVLLHQDTAENYQVQHGHEGDNMIIKIYNCFHDCGSIPNEKYHSDLRPSLLCGADVEWRNNQDIICNFRDNIGENISKEHEQ